jgi:excisionase family DNA binding protein
MSELLTVNDVAVRLHADPQTIRLWIRIGILKGVKVGRRWLVLESEIRRVANEGTSQPTNKDSDVDTKAG